MRGLVVLGVHTPSGIAAFRHLPEGCRKLVSTWSLPGLGWCRPASIEVLERGSLIHRWSSLRSAVPVGRGVRTALKEPSAVPQYLLRSEGLHGRVSR